jgi:hypothetical protein
LREGALLLFSGLGILVLLGRALFMVLTTLLQEPPAEADVLAAAGLGGISTITCALLLLPVLIATARRLQGKELRAVRLPGLRGWYIPALAGLWLLAVLVCGLLSGLLSYGWIPSIPFFLAGILLPALGLSWLAMNGLASGSWRRVGAVLGLGMTVSPFLSILAEYGLMGLAGLAAVAVAAGNPEWQTAIETIKSQLEQSTDIQSALVPLAPYLAKPLVFLALLAFAAVLGPLIEEACKSIAVWLVGRRLRSRAEGFYLGALSGAGFAILEGCLSASGAGSMLGVGLLGRAASTLMHISASAILGWGVAAAILEKRYGRLLLSYLASVSLHGLWNGSALLAVYGALRTTASKMEMPDMVSMLFMLAGVGLLVFLFGLILALLPLINRYLQKTHRAPASDIMPPPNS